MKRGIRNNNPGNIRGGKLKWRGQIGVDADGYVIFDVAVNGLRAIALDLLTKMERAVDTVREIITVYAPPSENDTQAYIDDVRARLGVQEDDILNLNHPDVLARFVRAIVVHENGSCPYTDEQIDAGCRDALRSVSLLREVQ